jgi:glycerophosphoryl diester phosphodiesterase
VPQLAESPDRLPRVFAHRGASTDAPEHSLAAYRAAIEQGADGIECDVRLTADGYLVCVHDRRVNRTTNGRGVVSTLELAELAALNFAARHDEWRDFEDPEEPDHDRSTVVTLDQLLELVVDAGRRVEIAIETKHPTRYAGLVERAVVETLRRFGLGAPSRTTSASVFVMSFSWLGLRRVRTLAPRIPTVLLMDRVPLRMRDGTLPVGVTVTGPSIEIVRAHPGYVDLAHGHGHDVFVWTVNHGPDVQACVEAGVDVIITDRPAATRARLAAPEV